MKCEDLTHITDALEVSGGVKQLFLLARKLREQGLCQLIVCPPGAVAEAFEKDGFGVTRVSMYQDYDLPAAWKILRLIRREKINLVHAHHPKAHALALIARHLYPFRLVVSRRVTHKIPWYPTSCWKYGSKRIDRFICVSEAVKKELLRIGVCSKKLVVIPSSTDFDRFYPQEPNKEILQLVDQQPTTNNQQPLIMGVIANYSPWKGQDLFLEALCLLKEEFSQGNFKAILAGRDTNCERLRKKISELKLERQVIALGWRDDVEKILSVLNALVCPSLAGEGSSGAIREAFAIKIAVIASDIEANTELVNEERGWLFSSGNPRHLALTLLNFLKTPVEIKKARAECAFNFAREKFSVETMAKETLEVYRGLLLK